MNSSKNDNKTSIWLGGLFCVATLSCAAQPPETQTPDLEPETEPTAERLTADSLNSDAVEAPNATNNEDEVEVVATTPLPRIRIERTTRVFASPSLDADVLGVIVKGTVAEKLGDSDAPKCRAGWTSIAPRGWVCTKSSSTDESISTNALPRLDRKRAVPGTAGRIREGRKVFANRIEVLKDKGTDGERRTVRMTGTERIGDTVYWTLESGELVAARDVRRSRGSSFEGVYVDNESELQLPIAFAHKEKARAKDVPIYDEPGGRRIGELSPREAVNIVKTTHNGRWLKTAEDGWISGRDARVVKKAAPPETVADDEVWLDFNRDSQIVVVYRGADPIYATLTSSGKYGHRTPVGVYRVEKKVAKTTMNSRPDAEEPYEVKNVPWSLFFHHGFAVHGAYWHNKFGTPISHGCLNLAPTDAKVVYDMLGPEVPSGWSVVTSTFEKPGSVVRVKTNKAPKPALRGSAEVHAKALKAARAKTTVAAR